LGELQALPLWKAFAPAAAANLIGESAFLAFGVAKDDRTQFATVALVEADDLFALDHGLGK